MPDANEATELKPMDSASYLLEFNDYLTSHTGLTFSSNRLAELKRGLQLAAQEFGYNDAETCASWLMKSTLTKSQIEILSSYLTVGETYFFREKDSFDILEHYIIPGLIEKTSRGLRDRRLRIWSAACSSGEEAYSIATILDRKREQLQDWDITVLGTDINVKAIEKANSGIYSEWSMRTIPDWMRNVYFKKGTNKTYEIIPRLRGMVQFEYLNLAEDVYPSVVNNTNAMDIIFCRNVLMYFLEQKAGLVVQRLYRALVEGGWLMVAPTDAFHLLNNEWFQKSNLGASIFNRKEPQPAFEAPASPYTAPVTTATREFKKISKRTVKERNKVTDKEIKKETTDEIYAGALKHYKGGNYREVLRLLEEAVARPVQPSLSKERQCKRYALIARTYANRGQLDEASNWCRKAIDTDKLNPANYYLQATIHQEQGSGERATESLKKCLYIDQDYTLAHFTLGNIFFNRENKAESQRHLNKALRGLEKYGDDEVVSIEESLTAGRLKEIIMLMLGKEK